ncbi:protein kinase; inhibitor of host transcription; positively regulates RNaseIII; negatively on RNaseE [Ralstonia phage RSB1]|uniref:Protein kinase-like n=1 Tax=Ralstonia phage RSB1 TaxID=551790 RepID=B5BTU3_9CAUD|nr:protein kinase; inhibitor of host transcription; positively regulates RNaseIII; negatively on RNaseE [Ralstonia phage RSB1]BAG70365.1 protein kinase-like [Ralstonia phage RSB1]
MSYRNVIRQVNKAARRNVTPAQANVRACLAAGRKLLHSDDMWAARKEIGLRELGSGYFSSVFEGFGGLVIKVGRELDGGYVYALWAQSKVGHPGVPQIEAVQRVGSHGYVVVMERLAPANPGSDYIRGEPSDQYDAACQAKYKEMADISGEYADCPAAHAVGELRRFMKWAAQDDSPYFDLHPGNVMLRGDTLVVTDPLARVPSTGYKFNKARFDALLKESESW